MNYNDMNDEDRLLEQEQQNSAQGFDPIGTGMDVYNLNNKIVVYLKKSVYNFFRLI